MNEVWSWDMCLRGSPCVLKLMVSLSMTMMMTNSYGSSHAELFGPFH